jgi:hypothetical protein
MAKRGGTEVDKDDEDESEEDDKYDEDETEEDDKDEYHAP